MQDTRPKIQRMAAEYSASYTTDTSDKFNQEDAENIFSFIGPTPSELEREEELLEQIPSGVQRDTAEPSPLTRQRAISIPQTMDQRLASLEMIIASQQKQLDELKKQVDSKASVSICAVSKNMFFVQDGEYIFVKNMQTSE